MANNEGKEKREKEYEGKINNVMMDAWGKMK